MKTPTTKRRAPVKGKRASHPAPITNLEVSPAPDRTRRATKDEAALYLGLRTKRTVERYVEEGRLHVVYERRGRTRSVATYDWGELDLIKAELETPVHRGQSISPGEAGLVRSSGGALTIPQPARSQQLQPAGVFELLERIAQQAQTSPFNSQVMVKDKLGLSIEECSDLTGLSMAFIESQIAAGKLKVVRSGQGIKRTVRRVDLDLWFKRL